MKSRLSSKFPASDRLQFTDTEPKIQKFQIRFPLRIFPCKNSVNKITQILRYTSKTREYPIFHFTSSDTSYLVSAQVFSSEAACECLADPK